MLNINMNAITKPTLMIHEINERIFSIPLENYTLTFDDGLYSQFCYWPKIKLIPTKKYFFISTNNICSGQHQNTNFVSSIEAHKKVEQGNYEDFMTAAQIKELAKDPNVVIGGHGHAHKNLRRFSKATEQIKYIIEDTRQMMAWFSFHLGAIPTNFCFPYNDDLNGTYKGLLLRYGFTEFHGSERIPVESLL